MGKKNGEKGLIHSLPSHSYPINSMFTSYNNCYVKSLNGKDLGLYEVDGG